jgi:hypothetical protein
MMKRMSMADLVLIRPDQYFEKEIEIADGLTKRIVSTCHISSL